MMFAVFVSATLLVGTGECIFPNLKLNVGELYSSSAIKSGLQSSAKFSSPDTVEFHDQSCAHA